MRLIIILSIAALTIQLCPAQNWCPVPGYPWYPGQSTRCQLTQIPWNNSIILGGHVMLDSTGAQSDRSGSIVEFNNSEYLVVSTPEYPVFKWHYELGIFNKELFIQGYYHDSEDTFKGFKLMKLYDGWKIDTLFDLLKYLEPVRDLEELIHDFTMDTLRNEYWISGCITDTVMALGCDSLFLAYRFDPASHSLKSIGPKFKLLTDPVGTESNPYRKIQLAFYKGNLYVGGRFRNASGKEVYLYKWDGNALSEVNHVLISNRILDMIVFDNKLYLAMKDQDHQDLNNKNIVYLNDENVVLPSFSDENILVDVINFKVINSSLHALKLPKWGSNDSSRIMRLNSSTGIWNNIAAIGTGVDKQFYDYAILNGHFYVTTGAFEFLEGKTEFLTTNCSTSGGVNWIENESNVIKIFPNPTNMREVTFYSPGHEEIECTISLYDTKGRSVKHNQGDLPLALELRNLMPGNYKYSVVMENGRNETGTLIISK